MPQNGGKFCFLYRQYGGLFSLIRGCWIEISISRNAQTLLKFRVVVTRLIQLKHAVALSFFGYMKQNTFTKTIFLNGRACSMKNTLQMCTNWYIQINFLIECWTNLICVFLGIFYIYLFHLKICPLTNCSQIYDDFVEKLAHVAKIESQNVLTAVAARMVLDSNFLTVSWFLHQNLWPRQCRALRTKSCFTCSIW